VNQISGWSFPWLFVFSAAARRLQVAGEGRDSRIGRLGGRDARVFRVRSGGRSGSSCPVPTSGSSCRRRAGVGVGVAAGVPAQLALLPCRA